MSMSGLTAGASCFSSGAFVPSGFAQWALVQADKIVQERGFKIWVDREQLTDSAGTCKIWYKCIDSTSLPTLAQKKWRWKELDHLLPPLGNHYPTFSRPNEWHYPELNEAIKARCIIRELSYIPLFSFRVGFDYMRDAIQTIYQRAFRNDNTISREDKELDLREILCTTWRSYKVELNARQRMAVVGSSLVLLFRGALALCQCGWLFWPLDQLVHDRY